MTTTITIRQAVHPAQAKSFDTAELREAFHVDGLFQADEVRLTYWHVDRLVVGGAMPVSRELRLEAPKAIGTSFFLDRREAAFVNLGGPARITADGEAFDLGALDILYLGRGARDVRMAGAGGEAAKLYIVSAPAHQSHPHRRITADEAKVVKVVKVAKAASPQAALGGGGAWSENTVSILCWSVCALNGLTM